MSKVLFFLADGLSDVNTTLETKTPLKEAKTPFLDSLMESGHYGSLDPFAPGYTCGSDTAHLALFGANPLESYRGRGIFEALGVVPDIEPFDLVYKTSIGFWDERSWVVTKRGLVGLTEAIKVQGIIETLSKGLKNMVRFQTKEEGVSVFINQSLFTFEDIGTLLALKTHPKAPANTEFKNKGFKKYIEIIIPKNKISNYDRVCSHGELSVDLFSAGGFRSILRLRGLGALHKDLCEGRGMNDPCSPQEPFLFDKSAFTYLRALFHSSISQVSRSPLLKSWKKDVSKDSKHTEDLAEPQTPLFDCVCSCVSMSFCLIANLLTTHLIEEQTLPPESTPPPSRLASYLSQFSMTYLLRAASYLSREDSFEKRWGWRALMVADTPVIKGVGKLLGFRVVSGEEFLRAECSPVSPPGFARKQKATEAFGGPQKSEPSAHCISQEVVPSEFDFIFIHFKEADEAGHSGDFQKKVEVLEKVDKACFDIFENMKGEMKDFTVVFTGDHSTPCVKKDHSFEPVPFVLTRSKDVSLSTEYSSLTRGDRLRKKIEEDMCFHSDRFIGRFPMLQFLNIIKRFN